MAVLLLVVLFLITLFAILPLFLSRVAVKVSQYKHGAYENGASTSLFVTVFLYIFNRSTLCPLSPMLCHSLIVLLLS